jgi:preprotein translocase subunit Sss1
MDDFVSVLRKGASGTGKGPVLLAAGLMAALVSAIGLIQYTEYGQALLSDTADFLPSLLLLTLTTVLPLVVTPYLLGGALGYAVRMASGDKPGWPEFFASARKHYMNLFFAGIIAYLIYMILGVVIVGVIYLGTAGSLIFCGLALPVVLFVFVCLMTIEFYDIAIVSENVGFMKSFFCEHRLRAEAFQGRALFFLDRSRQQDTGHGARIHGERAQDNGGTAGKLLVLH